MWRQGIVHLVLIGLMVGILGTYLWKQAHPIPPPPVGPTSPMPSDSSALQNPTRWPAAVGEVPHFQNSDGVYVSTYPKSFPSHSATADFPGPFSQSQPPTDSPAGQEVPAVETASAASGPTVVKENLSPQELPAPELLPVEPDSKPALSALASSEQTRPAPEGQSDQKTSPSEMPEAPWIEETHPTETELPEPSAALSPKNQPVLPSDSSRPSPLSQSAESAELSAEAAGSKTQESLRPIHFAKAELRLLTPSATDDLSLRDRKKDILTGSPNPLDARKASANGPHLSVSPSSPTWGPNPLDDLDSLPISPSAPDSESDAARSPVSETPPVSDGQQSGPRDSPSGESSSASEGESSPSSASDTRQSHGLGSGDSPESSRYTSLFGKLLPETARENPTPTKSSPQTKPSVPDASDGLEREGDVCSSEECRCVCQAARQSHQTLFYENRFDYLDDPCSEPAFLGDSLKRLPLRPWATLDIGGEYRLRHHSERNHRGQGLTGQDDDFLLHRTRLYANLELGEMARIYAEMNDALSTNETYLPRRIEEDRTELQNLFIDVPMLGYRSEGLVARLGRQELLYGAQRLVSPLDWANTRRTFEGYKLFWNGPVWSVDAFWVQPVYPNPQAFDSPDQSQQFMGLYLVRRLGTQAVLEGYYLRLVEEDGIPDFDFHTLGLRSQQEYNGWLGELEAALQVGSYGAADHSAGMYTIGMGRRFCCLPGKPVFWMYYDWASGDPTLGNGFHHLFPLSHQYLGWMDLFGRRNIEDWSFHLLVHPHSDWTIRFAWHIFHRQHPLDVPYGVDMEPLVSTPGGSGDYGQEFDLVLQWAIRPRAELSFGYSRFFAGEFFRTNPSPAPYQNDADFFYTQFTLRF